MVIEQEQNYPLFPENMRNMYRYINIGYNYPRFSNNKYFWPNLWLKDNKKLRIVLTNHK